MTEAKNGSSTLPINQILCGECVETMKTLPSEYIDLTQFSPPYWGLRDYGVQGQIGLEDHPTKYVEKMVQICQEIKRLLKKTGSMYIVIGDTYFGGNLCVGQPEDWDSLSTLNKDQKYNSELFNDFIKNRNKLRSNWLQPKQLMGIPWRVAIALQEDGWILRNDIIWNKPNHMPSSVRDRLTNAYEHILHFVKSRRYYYDLDAIREKPASNHSSGNKKRKLSSHPHNRHIGHSIPWDNPSSPKPSVESYNGKFGGFGEESEKFGSPRARTQRFQTQKEPYLQNNPHTMRLEPEQHTALDPSAPMDLSHPLGKNSGDVLKFKGDETKNAGRLARSRELYREQGLPEGHPLGMNPSDFWTITTKPFKGAHFAVYPEAVCMRPILSSCPPDGIVLDPMCGSGTTLAVAKKLGRKYLGIELNPAYIEIANKRLSEIPEKITSFL